MKQTLQKTGAASESAHTTPNMQESDAFGAICIDIAEVFFALLPI
jgi:hypothetical protein